jgi:hypothetical protein
LGSEHEALNPKPTYVVAARTHVDYLGPTSICQDPVTAISTYLYLTE